MRYVWSTCLALLLGTLQVMAAVPAVDADAIKTVAVYDINTSPSNTHPYLQLALGDDIYRYSRHSDLQDLVVIDAQGNLLPHRIINTPVVPAAQQSISHVHFFPVPVGATAQTLRALSSASIHRDDHAIAIRVEQTPAAPQTAIDFYVVDLTSLKVAVDKLQLDWQAAEANAYLDVVISGSNDLSRWSPVAQGTLVQLQKNGQTLTRQQIALNLYARQYAYLRLQFPRGGQGLQLTAVQVIAQQPPAETVHAATIVDKRWQVPGHLAEDQTSALNTKPAHNTRASAWEFTRDEIAPATGISLALGETRYGDHINVFSRRTQNQPWQLLHQGVWFNAQVGDLWQHSDSINIRQNTDLFWRVELNAQVRNSAAPILVFHRQPEWLQFIASSAAPFKVAIRTGSAQQNQRADTQVFLQLIASKTVQWQTVDTVALAPEMNLLLPVDEPVNWSALVFWAMLLLAVVGLIVVAIRLIKTVGADSNSQ